MVSQSAFLKHAKDTYFENEWSKKYLVKVGLNVIDLQQDKKSKLTRISKNLKNSKLIKNVKLIEVIFMHE